HPRLVTQLVALRRRRGRVIVVNPLRELGLVRFRVPSDWRSMLIGSTVSDLYLQPHVGADVALFKALLKGVVEAGGVDGDFVAAHTSGWEAVEADLAATPWDALLDASGVARPAVARARAACGRPCCSAAISSPATPIARGPAPRCAAWRSPSPSPPS